MSLKIRTLLILAIGALLGFSLSLGPRVLADREAKRATDTLPWEDARLLAEVMERVKQDYVDRVTDQQLIESAIRGMLSGLDSHSAFLDPEEYDEIRISTTGHYSGVGIEVTLEDGAVRVVAPIEGTPAAAAGIRPGDVIVSVDGIDVDGDSLERTIDRMRGEAGTTVVVAVAREGVDHELEFSLERANVEVHSVRSASLDGDIGYVRISHFSDTTATDLNRALTALHAATPKGLKGLILDLRNNPGGVLEAAVSVSDAFLDDGMIVRANGRAADARFEMDAHPGDLLQGAPMVVLVNGGSASASEIVAGALQDHHRATLIGHRTYGKGSVQTVMPLSDGRAIKLTTSRYYTPSGRSIHEKGITPDISLVDPQPEVLAGTVEDGGPAVPASDPEVRIAIDTLLGGRIRHSRAP
jgi:carboxyl-terminal processing protease